MQVAAETKQESSDDYSYFTVTI